VLLAIAVTTLALAGTGVLATPASAASKTADLSVTLTDKNAKPGHRVSYIVKVTNHGPATAKRVNIDFTTNRALTAIHYNGRCIPSTKETACLIGTLTSGHSFTTTLTGKLSKRLKKGTAVTNKVTVASDTHLSNKGNDAATDNFRIGMPKAAPVVAAPTPSANPNSKLAQVTNAATETLNVTSSFLTWSIIALSAAALWFVIGLSWHAIKRRRRPMSDPE